MMSGGKWHFKLALLLGAVASILTGCASEKGGLNIGLFAEMNKLDKEWKNNKVESFEKRFGEPIEKSNANNTVVMRWTKTSAPFWVPSQLYYQSMGPNMSMRVHKPAHYETANCIIAVSNVNGCITGIQTVEDGWIDKKSFCQTFFGI
ncbi:hypothetical protein ACFSE0_06805 [Ochrobactrum teleogrylli]|uniref:Lipoprotein n=1 Tax=Ochrobactrum teleogrylli TaxID=2479765 RepID=A0ABY2Y0K9_9HYPH|nr:hypothetical protein [[Ochrobactrum] teleogrylli]TNV09118.1 hypothetical protein FIC94_22255 [[Ochrobactrum] teleogrylli]